TSGQSEVRECDDRKLRTIALLTALGTPDLMAPGAGCGLIRQQGGVVLPVTHDTERATKQRIRETNNTPSRTPAAQSRHYGKTGRWAYRGSPRTRCDRAPRPASGTAPCSRGRSHRPACPPPPGTFPRGGRRDRHG